MENCIFCRIASGEIPARVISTGETWLSFYDTTPQAPVHALVIPKVHIRDINELIDPELSADLILGIRQTAAALNLTEGYRVVNNLGSHGGQTVYHIHFHILGGRRLLWPPG